MRADQVRVLAAPGGTGGHGNPYIDQLTAGVRSAGVRVQEFTRRRLLSRPSVVHVHWPAALVRWESAPVAVADVVQVLVLTALARLRGAKLVWTAHDLEPHELPRPRLYRVYFAMFSRMVDLWISLTEAGAAQLRVRYPVLARRPLRVIAHGSYRPVYAARPDRRDAERRLGLAPNRGRGFLLLGQIRRYKNAAALVRAFTATPPAGERLVIAGEVRDPRLAAELAAAAGDRSDVVLRLGRVPEEEVPFWHGAADVVVLPYDDRSVLNSGALLLALSLDVPVVAPDSPVNREVRDAVGGAWVQLYRGGPTEALAAARDAAAPGGRSPDLSVFAWPTVIRDTVESYRDVVGGRA